MVGKLRIRRAERARSTRPDRLIGDDKTPFCNGRRRSGQDALRRVMRANAEFQGEEVRSAGIGKAGGLQFALRVLVLVAAL